MDRMAEIERVLADARVSCCTWNNLVDRLPRQLTVEEGIAIGRHEHQRQQARRQQATAIVNSANTSRTAAAIDPATVTMTAPPAPMRKLTPTEYTGLSRMAEGHV